MKRILSILLIMCVLCFVGCNSTDNKKQVVTLTKDNYRDYLTITTTSETIYLGPGPVTTVCYDFQGALLFDAYYENVIITYEYMGQYGKTIEETLKLNVGGCGSMSVGGLNYQSSSFKITDVTGKVIYYI